MRKECIETLLALAQEDPSIYLLQGDLGFSFLEEFGKRFPDRYINCGVAEQNMMGVAAGLALEGKKVYVYSIIPFAIFRCFEQLRNDIAYHNANVTIIGAGAGFAYGTHGATHFGVEDIAVASVLPNLTILSPADPLEMSELLTQAYQAKNPTYIRLDKTSKALHRPGDKITLGTPTVFGSGTDGVIITTGSYLEVILQVQQKLKNDGYQVKVVHLHTIQPINHQALIEELRGQKIICTAEEHKLVGGIGTMINEILLANNIQATIRNIGIKNEYPSVIGKQEYLRQYYGIDQDSVYEKLLTLLKQDEKK